MTALLIVGHGTRDLEGAAQFRAFTERVGARAAARPELAVDDVGGGVIELSAPPVRDAVAALVAQGWRDVVAVPLILLAAGHAKGDIPASLARERARHPGLRTRYARPLGVHPVVVGLLRERLAASGQPQPDGVLLVGRGTTDPDANADLYRAARLLWETTRQLGVEFVEPAFVSLAWPSVGQGLERLRRLGARRVTVLPYFLFTGVLPGRIVAQSAQAAAGSGLEVSVAEVIGDCDALADLVLDRYAEAVRGPVAANCDACVYRIALPGFEHRVGAAQHPHDHPDDPAHPHGHSHAHQSHDSVVPRHTETPSVR
ncbi:MAG TPA: CbiX/SirB N-terminal domain-containing protein [Actinocrinis sp.]|uniref:sirohydrochlorin chelatase n=1 Tax=Actinocrinis sp. TaxID=1920516 RepID=UPI002DDCCDFD|nr:CbiX/SirB N-terminal domain-containing protein [Actinocrinis sp.]HEV2343372.1 CbiX/SirB N-terminal domain-containing protein [Actinocrinis sp.]